jgi:NAD-dependent SIR2 family protein deacetylase
LIIEQAGKMSSATKSVPTVSVEQFASIFALRPHLFSWLLGAGASAASGIPTGYAMIRDFRKRIYCRETGYKSAEIDAGDPLWVERIDEFFRKHALLPPEDDPSTYSKAFEMVFPDERHRRQYIDDAISKGNPSYAHRALASLMANGKVSCVFTTNFDPLIENSAIIADQLLPPDRQSRPTVAALDSADRALRCLAESDWPLIAKLHGDYQSVAIKNTGNELEKQDERMRQVLIQACGRFGLVLVGYSGRDTSVMETLTAALQQKPAFPAGLFWVTSSVSKLLPAVRTFLDAAINAGVNVAAVECQTFDELAAVLIGEAKLPDVLRAHVVQHQGPPRLQAVKLVGGDSREFPVLRYSALRIESMPTVARRIVLNNVVSSEQARKLLKDAKCRAVVAAMGRELAAFGKDDEILAAFASLSPKTLGNYDLDPENDSRARGLIYEALVKALASRHPLIPRYKSSGHALLVAAPRGDEDEAKRQRRVSELKRLTAAYESSLTGHVPVLAYPYHEGVHLKLDSFEGRWWCGFEPFTFVDLPREPEQQADTAMDELGRSPARRPDPAGDWRRERWAQKYNGHWARIIDAWAAMLAPTDACTVTPFKLPHSEGVGATFVLSPWTGFSRPAHHHHYFERTK